MGVAIFRSCPGLDCEVVTDFGALEAIAGEWHRLWAGSPDSEIFQSFGWARAYWKAFDDELSLFAPVVYRGSSIVGILPLAIKRNRLQFADSTFSDYNDIICADEFAAEVIRAAFEGLLRARKHWDDCVLENVPAHSRLIRHLPDLGLFTKHFRTAFRCPCPTIVLEGDAALAKKLACKKSLRRHERQLLKVGDLEFRHIECREEIGRYFELFSRQHIARRAIAGDRSHYLEPRTRKFFQTLVDELDPRTLLRFSVLALNERPVAFHFGFEVNRKLLIYQPTFDIDYWDFSPGEVLLRNLLLYAHERKLSEVDMTRGGEPYKDRFATDIRDNLTVYFNHDVNPCRWVPVAVQRANGGFRKAVEHLRHYPPVYRCVRTAALKILRSWRRDRRLTRSQASWYGTDAVRQAFRSLIFHRVSILTFPISKHQVLREAGSPDDGLSVSRVGLSGLALFSVTQPDIARSLNEFKDRLAAGTQIYVVSRNAKIIQVWYVALKNLSQDGQASGDGGDILRIERRWTAPGFHGVGSFRGILQQIRDRDMDAVIICEKGDPVAREIADAGLQTSLRATHYRILHWFRPVFVTRATSHLS
jgi:CelD/BcsL family acetyltransferase involved in cellulose biosynthesis